MSLPTDITDFLEGCLSKEDANHPVTTDAVMLPMQAGSELIDRFRGDLHDLLGDVISNYLGTEYPEHSGLERVTYADALTQAVYGIIGPSLFELSNTELPSSVDQ